MRERRSATGDSRRSLDAGQADARAEAIGRGVQYGQLKERNPEWLGEYWRECRALYAGGPRLLKDEQLMKRCSLRTRTRRRTCTRTAQKRAFYIAYAGEIIDHLIAGFAQDPIRLSAGVDETTTAEKSYPSGGRSSLGTCHPLAG
jgi:hypothetical protein